MMLHVFDRILEQLVLNSGGRQVKAWYLQVRLGQ